MDKINIADAISNLNEQARQISAQLAGVLNSLRGPIPEGTQSAVNGPSGLMAEFEFMAHHLAHLQHQVQEISTWIGNPAPRPGQPPGYACNTGIGAVPGRLS